MIAVSQPDVMLVVCPDAAHATPRRSSTARRIALRCTRGRPAEYFGLLVAGGDVWGGLTELNETRFRRPRPPGFSYQELCTEVAGVGVVSVGPPPCDRCCGATQTCLLRRARPRRAGHAAR